MVFGSDGSTLEYEPFDFLENILQGCHPGESENCFNFLAVNLSSFYRRAESTGISTSAGENHFDNQSIRDQDSNASNC